MLPPVWPASNASCCLSHPSSERVLIPKQRRRIWPPLALIRMMGDSSRGALGAQILPNPQRSDRMADP
jgi:hypothetical protein